MLADTSSAFRPSQFSLSLPLTNTFLRMYLNIHSPTMVCAIASTTLVCWIDGADEFCRSREKASPRGISRHVDCLLCDGRCGGAVKSSKGSDGLRELLVPEDTDMPGEEKLPNASGWEAWDMVVADRTRRSVGSLERGCRGGRSVKFLLVEEGVGLCRPLSPPLTFLELCRAGTGIGGAMLFELPLPLEIVLGSLGRAR